MISDMKGLRSLPLLLLAAIIALFAATATSNAQPVASVSAAKHPRALTKNCTPLKKKAAKRACLKQNQARIQAAKQIAGYAFVGSRGDGEAVDWRQCSNGRWLHISDGSYGRSISDGRGWRVTHAVVRRNGKWFDAVVTGPVQGGKSQVGIARRGKQFQVAIVTFDTNISSYGNVKRSKITNKDCVRTS
jgi:hypothetical protein